MLLDAILQNRLGGAHALGGARALGGGDVSNSGESTLQHGLRARGGACSRMRFSRIGSEVLARSEVLKCLEMILVNPSIQIHVY